MSGFRTFVVAALALQGLLHAQGNVTIFGNITDPTGGAIPGVSVQVVHTQTGAARDTKTDPSGAYVISQLPIGTYTLTAEVQGFKKFVQDQIQVQVDENRRVDARLEVGSV